MVCDANGLEGNLLPSSYMSCLSAPGGQLGSGRVALHSRVWNNALRWFRSQKPHSADQQRRVPGAHAALRCVPTEGQRLSRARPAHAFCFCVHVCKKTPAFPLSSPQIFAFRQSWLIRPLSPNLPAVIFPEQLFYSAG